MKTYGERLQGMNRAQLQGEYDRLFDARECTDDKEERELVISMIAEVIDELGKRPAGFVVVIDAEDGRHYLSEHGTRSEAIVAVELWLNRKIDASQTQWYSNYGPVIYIEGKE